MIDPAAEREHVLARLKFLKEQGERAYDLMYEVHSFTEADGHYSDAKEAFREAIGVAERAGLEGEATALMERLLHIKAVYRSQFSR